VVACHGFALVSPGQSACIHDFVLEEGKAQAAQARRRRLGRCFVRTPASVQWSYSAGDAQAQAIRDLVVDSQGNAIVVGDFRGTLDFDLGPLPSAGGFDQFVAKLDCSGQPLLAVRFGSEIEQELFTRVAVDSEDNIVIAGELIGTFDFGGGPISSDDGDVFVVKLSPAGGFVWQRTFAGAGGQLARAVAVVVFDRVLVAGYLPDDERGRNEALQRRRGRRRVLLRLDGDGEPLDRRAAARPRSSSGDGERNWSDRPHRRHRGHPRGHELRRLPARLGRG
jgi:hypothetical protein